MTITIDSVHGREVLDSRGNPTVEVEVVVNGSKGRFIVPSGASTGAFEAVELRDSGDRYMGKGVLQAVKNVNESIGPKVIGRDAQDQQGLDQLMIELDGTENKSKLGANAILGVSIANIKAVAEAQNSHIFEVVGNKTRLPCPMLNVINGGKHAGGDLAIQEFMLMPLGFDAFSEALRAGSEVYHNLKKVLKNKYGATSTNVGDEGGFAPPIQKAHQAIDALIEAIRAAGYEPEEQFYLGIDSAASEFFTDGKYSIDGQELGSEEFLNYYIELLEEYPILLSIEDPFDENDFEMFGRLVKARPDRAIVGDDLVVTNVNRIETAVKYGSMNYLLLKVNQIGSYTEAREAFDLTKAQDWGVVISHRSGETEDSFIADLAVGWGAERIKTGAPARSERVAKYNQLLRIEEFLGDRAEYSNSI